MRWFIYLLIVAAFVLLAFVVHDSACGVTNGERLDGTTVVAL